MARTKRKVKNRAKSHIKPIKAARRKRLRASGGFRTAESRSRRRAGRLAAKARRS
ncbi:MAG TPA: hypothetical protein PLW65_33415 [Pseudomonadota bacterium]|nr:hypothetical protein [Pseudomonadota bacterium]